MTLPRFAISPALLFVGLMMLCALPAAAAEFLFPPLREGAVAMDVPERWQADEEIGRDPSGDAYTARFIDAIDGNFVILVTVIQTPPAPATVVLTPEQIRASVQQFADEAELRSVEPELTVQTLTTDGLFGAYFSATDKAPDIDEFRFLTQGFASLNGIPVSFTALSNREPERARDEVLAAVSSMRVATER